ncbi:ABC transporter ATP-binding protein [Paenibacillus sp. B01]|uniref:ABC transporter ATP-binding protein n=1 Tax=Paenibacillus sp. B01 TaxID=2660554 RepID=UPI00129C0C6D|nr:dipeptide/oligopeptide/nickel ABC transporter ATP-binding protein [Paenibacillus sp. B01]QGG57365.1 ATP-binding cassette domain-containing protein [Paenibacillus sp. B01]
MSHSTNRAESPPTEPLLAVRGLRKQYEASAFSSAGKEVLRGVDFQVQPTETVGIVGLSGAGKSTIGRLVAGLERPDGGEILYSGQSIGRLRGAKRRQAASGIEMIFQDPYESLSPRMRIADLVAEPLRIRKKYRGNRAGLEQAVRTALANVSLPPERYMARYPHELSGGERQRVGLARAFVDPPRLVIADEPTSMLDSSLRLELLALMDRLRRDSGTATMLITHDLALAYRFCDRLLVLSDGEIVESGTPAQVIEQPAHPFTLRLVQALREFHP